MSESISDFTRLLPTRVVGVDCVVTMDTTEEVSGDGKSGLTMHLAVGGVPNKPMVPTATYQPSEGPVSPLRRHIGRPFGSQRFVGGFVELAELRLDWNVGASGGERRAAPFEEQNGGHGRRAMGSERRAASDGRGLGTWL